VNAGGSASRGVSHPENSKNIEVIIRSQAKRTGAHREAGEERKKRKKPDGLGGEGS